MRNGYHPGIENSREQTLKERGFYHSTAWRRIRQQALHRDHYLCQECLKKKKVTPATEVHHIVPLESAPSLGLELSNLQSLCWYCHEATKHSDHDRQEISKPGVNVLKIKDGSEMSLWPKRSQKESGT